MGESTGQTGRGIFLELEDGASPTGYVVVGNVTSISVQGANAEEQDFTHLLSEGGFREFRQGFKDAGTLGVNYHLDATEDSHTQLFADFLTGRMFNGRIDFGAAGWAKYMTFRGFVQNPGDVEINVDGPMTGAATIRRSGGTQFVDK